MIDQDSKSTLHPVPDYSYSLVSRVTSGDCLLLFHRWLLFVPIRSMSIIPVNPNSPHQSNYLLYHGLLQTEQSDCVSVRKSE